MFKKWFVCEARTGEHLFRTVFLREIGDNPVRVYIRNRTGENTQKVYFRLHSSARSKQSNVEVRDGACTPYGISSQIFTTVRLPYFLFLFFAYRTGCKNLKNQNSPQGTNLTHARKKFYLLNQLCSFRCAENAKK